MCPSSKLSDSKDQGYCEFAVKFPPKKLRTECVCQVSFVYGTSSIFTEHWENMRSDREKTGKTGNLKNQIGVGALTCHITEYNAG